VKNCNFIPVLTILYEIKREHSITNCVRHDFLKISKDEALAATYNFLRFCSICGIEKYETINTLRDSLLLWDEKRSRLEENQELKELKRALIITQQEKIILASSLEEYSEREKQLEFLDLEINKLNKELLSYKERVDVKDNRIDTLRKELFELKEERKDLKKKLDEYENINAYIENLNRFTSYTRTRRDFERSVTKLTTEQQLVVNSWKSKSILFVKGGAGTGKTLVLIEVLKRILKELDGNVTSSIKKPPLFLTYTRTLAKYDQYLSEIMIPDTDIGIISTIDSFYLKLLKIIDPNNYVDYRKFGELCKEYAVLDFISPEELEVEIEGFIFANDISMEEYIDKRIPRKGMRNPLSIKQRTLIWGIRDTLVNKMDELKCYSRNYSRKIILENIESFSEEIKYTTLGTVLIDETQDLTVVELKILKKLATGGILMAGDSDQTIYGVSSPYKRAGISIVGRTKNLHTNFRNTCSIHDFADKFRKSGVAGTWDNSTLSKAFREGPTPELHTGDTEKDLVMDLLSKINLYIDKIGYDPENLCIIAPRNTDIDLFKNLLDIIGFTGVNVKEAQFNFNSTGCVRLSTMHSSKGLDFPVVLLYLNSLPYSAPYDSSAAEKLNRNLIYVAMTRAMDNLDIFIKKNPEELIFQDLIKVYEEYLKEQN